MTRGRRPATRGSTAARRCGRRPSVDPKLGLLYFSTGNAGARQRRQRARGRQPLRGLDRRARRRRPASTAGTTRWCTTTSGTTTRRARPCSSTRRSTASTVHGIAEAEKTGWLYLLDRTNGKPLFPIPRRPVPQNAHQKTSKTQPIPSYPPYRRRTCRADAQVAAGREGAQGGAEERQAAARSSWRKDMYTPYWNDGHGPHARARRAARTGSRRATTRRRTCSTSARRAASRATPPRRSSPRSRSRASCRRRSAAPSRSAAASATNVGLLHGDRRDDRADRVAEALAGVLLRGLDDDGGRPRLRRPHDGEPAGVRREDRQAALAFQTGAGANNGPTIFRARRQAVPRVLRRRQRARGVAARRQPLALRPRRHARARPSRRAPARASATPARRRRRRDATPGDAGAGKRCSRTTARAATAPAARAATAGPT